MARESASYNNGIIHNFDLKRPQGRILYTFIVALGIIIAAVGVAPIIWVILQGFKEIREFVREPTILPKSFKLTGYIQTWKDLHIARYYLNSFISIIGCVAAAVFFNGLAGYVLSKIKPAGSTVIFMMIMWALLIPSTTSIVPLFINITKLKLTGTFIPIWLSLGANAFYVIMFKNFFDDLPSSLIEAAKIDGATDFSIFVRIVIPLSRAIVMVIVMYAVNQAWSDFLLPYLVLRDSVWETVVVRLYVFRGGSQVNDVIILRSIVFAVIPPIVLFFIFQKQITQVSMASGIKG
ncbi:ABC transporter [Spirochaetia bacterium]|nr:ABC transporter [Spirochaetia bacterium]